ncbi:hypothetical protein ACFRMQ_11040 [Kitasatospora sp. NPDC056783]|uniref:hypothetical protein n=1 Tax=Kitasatospora sp. NPDC056783 TaxID=3345943 RepID=UPI00368C3ECB
MSDTPVSRPNVCPNAEPQDPAARSGRCPDGHSHTPERRGNFSFGILALCFGSCLVLTLVDRAFGAPMEVAIADAGQWVARVGSQAVQLMVAATVLTGLAAGARRAKGVLTAASAMLTAVAAVIGEAKRLPATPKGSDTPEQPGADCAHEGVVTDRQIE